MDISEFKKMPVMGILRGVRENEISPLVDVVLSSGLRSLEITMNTANAPSLIKKAVSLVRGRLSIGAGTVLNTDLLRDAIDAGATFIVMPTLVTDVTEYCVKNAIPVFPGAMTPQEIYNAWNSGATMVKVFPAGFFGPAYFKEVKAPFNNIELMACGGVTDKNIKSYFRAGADAAAFGASIFKREWIEKKDYKSIEKAIKKFILPIKNNETG